MFEQAQEVKDSEMGFTMPANRKCSMAFVWLISTYQLYFTKHLVAISQAEKQFIYNRLNTKSHTIQLVTTLQMEFHCQSVQNSIIVENYRFHYKTGEISIIKTRQYKLLKITGSNSHHSNHSL